MLLLFLGSPAMAALVVITIPFSLLFALVLMYVTDIPIGLLSIGAIDFGILVDGAVIMADNIAHRLANRRRRDARCGRRVARRSSCAAGEVQRPIFFSMLMIIAAYLPLLTLTSIEGLLFRPMALTMVFALIGAVLFALFVVPAAATVLFRHGYREWENPLLTWFRPRYEALDPRRLMGIASECSGAALATMAAVALFVVPRLGTEFLPYLDEGVIWVRANFPEGTSLEQTAEFGKQIREIVLEFPDVQFVSVQAGRNDSGTDPFPPSRLEMMIGPKPRGQWVSASKQELVAAIGARLREEFPTTRFNFTQPIIDSVTEDTNGTSANLAVEFSGADLDVLSKLARQVVELLRSVPGAVDVNIEQEGPQPQLVIQPDRALCASYNVQIEDVNQLINTALGGEPVGTLYEGERRFDIVDALRPPLPELAAERRPPAGVLPPGVPVPLAQVAEFDVVDGQTMIAREGGRRRITVRCDIVGRDQGGFVAEVQQALRRRSAAARGLPGRVARHVREPRARQPALVVVIPITIALIYWLLVVTFRTQREALLVLLSIPFAFIGGALALYVRGMHFNVSTGVGFAALFGVSIMNGVLMVDASPALRRQGMDARRGHRAGGVAAACGRS